MKEITDYSFKRIFKQSIIYGLALGFFLEMVNILDYTVGFQEQSQIVNNIKYLLRILGLLICIIIFRKKSNGYLLFETAFIFSLFTFVFAIFTCDTMVCITFNIYPELLHNKIEIMKTTLQNAGTYSRLIELSANYTILEKNPYYVIFSFLIWVLFVGPLISFIFALMMKKEN
ncbi:MAG: DUF4199 family protein [Prevotellaceae bacterium]|nr:DUF4199 family protein [Prevotellaceae bacterium]